MAESEKISVKLRDFKFREGFVPYAAPSTGAFEPTNRQDSRFACVSTHGAENRDVFRETDIKTSRRISDTKTNLTQHQTD